MPPGPGILISGSFLAGYLYWRFSFRQVTAALRLERAGEIDRARGLFESFLTNRNPLTRRGESRSRCRLLLARLERKAGRYSDAVRAADELLRSGPSAGIALAARLVRADALAWGGDLDEALNAATHALADAKTAGTRSFEMELTGLICRIRSWRGDLDEACGLADDLIARGGPTAAYGHLRMSEICCARGDFDEAAAWARRLLEALSQEPQQAGGIPPAVEANSDSPDGRRPAASHTGAERLDPGKAGAGVWTALATAYGARAAFLAGGADGAREWLQDAERGRQLPAPDAVGWWGVQALAAFESGNEAQADQHLAEMRRIEGGSPPGYGARAWSRYYEGRMQMARGRFGEAADEMIEAIRSNPPADALPEYYYHLGLALQGSGKPGAAGAFTCGGRLPAAFYFTGLCKACAADAGETMRIES